MTKLIQLPKRPRHESLQSLFTTWAAKERSWPRAEAQRAWALVMAADGWLCENGSSLLTAEARNIQAYLFTCEPDPGTRNEIRDALGAFYECFASLMGDDWRESWGFSRNPAHELPHLPERPSDDP